VPLALIAVYSFNADPVNMMTLVRLHHRTGTPRSWVSQTTDLGGRALHRDRRTSCVAGRLKNSLLIAAFATTAIATVLGTSDRDRALPLRLFRGPVASTGCVHVRADADAGHRARHRAC
jgi:hypothetical protein